MSRCSLGTERSLVAATEQRMSQKSPQELQRMIEALERQVAKLEKRIVELEQLAKNANLSRY